MPKIIVTSAGKYILVGARGFLSIAGGATASNLTSLMLTDFTSTAGTSAYPVVQRKAGTTSGDVPVLFSFTTSDGQAPTNVQARVINATTSAVVKDWTALQNMSVTGSNALGTLSGVPQGGYYLLQIRDSGNAAIASNGSQKWGVGVVVLFEGQSNMVGTFNGSSAQSFSYTETVPGTSQNEYAYWLAGSVAGALFSTSGWAKPTGATNSNIDSASGGVLKFMRITAAALKAKYGYDVPVAIIPYAHNNKSLSVFRPGGPAYECLFNGTASAGYVGTVSFKSARNIYAGDFEMVVLHQGEADSGTDRATRLTNLKAYYQDRLNYVAPFGRNASSLVFLPAVLGSYSSSSVYGIEPIRQAVFDLEAFAKANNWPNVIIGWNCIDLDAGLDNTTGGLHFSNAPGKQYTRWSFMRMLQSILYKLGCATFSGAGPRIDTTSISRIGDVVTLKVAHERAGATLKVRDSGSAPTGWVANSALDFSGTDIPVVCAITASDTMQLTFTLPGGVTYASGVYLKYCGGRIGYLSSYRPDVSNPVCDDSTVPSTALAGDQITDGLPLLPTPDAIKVN